MNHDRELACEAERRDILQTALGLLLPDAVFELVHYNDFHRRFGSFPHCPPIPLSDLCPPHNMEDVKFWAGRAYALRHEAFDVGDALLSHDGSYDIKRREFISKHPGFASDTYKRAIDFGCWQAR